MKKNTLIQLSLIIVGGLLVAVLWASPKKFSEKYLAKQEEVKAEKELKGQIEEIKAKLGKNEVTKIETLEKNLSAAESKVNKLAAADSITEFWDRLMYPQVAAIYFEEKAKIADDEKTWSSAANRFLGLASFQGFEDKEWALTKAEKAFDKVLEKNPNNDDASIGKAICIVEKGTNPMKGVGILKSIVEKNPKNTKALLQLGHFNIRSGELQMAISRYKQALEADPSLTEIYFYLADTYGKAGNNSEGKVWFEKYRNTLTDSSLIKQLNLYMSDNYNIQ